MKGALCTSGGAAIGSKSLQRLLRLRGPLLLARGGHEILERLETAFVILRARAVSTSRYPFPILPARRTASSIAQKTQNH